jgi:hypothetical protein
MKDREIWERDEGKREREMREGGREGERLIER